MKKYRNVLATVFELLIIILGIIGILIQSGVFSSNFKATIFGYYTIISNLFCIFYLIAKIIYRIKYRGKKEFCKRFRGSVVMCILVTMIVYHFLLNGRFAMVSSVSLSLKYSNWILHYIVPTAIFLDWLFFDKKGYYQKSDPLIWLTLPLLYLVYALIIGHFKVIKFFDSYYPYYFIDPDKLGFGKVMFNVIMLIFFFIAFGFAIYWADHKISMHNKGNKK